jgi:hypothetical protein
MANEKLMKALKVVIPIGGIVASVAANWLKDKEFDEKVAQKVAETLAKTNGEES